MSGNKRLKIALVGNPNSGKSTIFNLLTGLSQKTGNFAGVTVERKSGICTLPSGAEVDVIDLPGTYSIYPKSYDEQLVFNILSDPQAEDFPDHLLVVADASNLKRNLLLFSQLADLHIPTLLILNMIDVAERGHTVIDEKKLEYLLGGIRVVKMNARKEIGVRELLETLEIQIKKPHVHQTNIFTLEERHLKISKVINNHFTLKSPYQGLLLANNFSQIPHLSPDKLQMIRQELKEQSWDTLKEISYETIKRYEKIAKIVDSCVLSESGKVNHAITQKLDRVLLHPVWGYVVLISSLLLIFQAIFAWAQYPMDLIDSGIYRVSLSLRELLGNYVWVDLLLDGLLAGIGGVLVFIPQIAILFFFISLLEETGYMSRIMFLMDQILRFFGLNGKSIIPLLSGAACAIPAILAARNINNQREKLLTIFVTPLISCSARIPVYTMIISLCIPATLVYGIIGLQALSLMALYVLGFCMALISALLVRPWIKTTENSYFILEMPDYKPPKFKNLYIAVLGKIKTFVWGAGKIIVGISMVLWFLSNFSWPGILEKTEQKVTAQYTGKELSTDELNTLIAAAKLEASFAGIIGKTLEPIIAPLGFDWKIGIALITSFAAREVFVGTISTIYSIGDGASEETLRQKLANQKDARTGKPFFNFARGMSLLIFYAFSLQCMSTVATVLQETKSLWITILQFLYLQLLAYGSSCLVYQLFS